MTSIKEDLIHKLQEEILFLQTTKLTDKDLNYYEYELKADLSETRKM